jgi:hypothetical protein
LPRVKGTPCWALKGYCLDPKLITEPKTSPYLEYMRSLVAGPTVVFRLPLALRPWGQSFHGYRPQSAVVLERQRPWVIGSSPSARRGHVGPGVAGTDGPGRPSPSSPPPGPHHGGVDHQEEDGATLGATVAPAPTVATTTGAQRTSPCPLPWLSMVSGPGLPATSCRRCARPPSPRPPLPAPGTNPETGLLPPHR